jgi:hypothetical protein
MRAIVNARTSRVLILISFLVPSALLVWFVGHYGVNVPHLDDWRMVDFIARAKAHDLSFSDFYGQFNEHRILLPKVIFALSVMSADWNLKLLMFCSVAIAALTCLLLLRLSAISRPVDEPPAASLCYTLVICLLVFSWAQFENWLWGFQVAWLLVNLGGGCHHPVSSRESCRCSSSGTCGSLLPGGEFSWRMALLLGRGGTISGCAQAERRRKSMQ